MINHTGCVCRRSVHSLVRSARLITKASSPALTTTFVTKTAWRLFRRNVCSTRFGREGSARVTFKTCWYQDYREGDSLYSLPVSLRAEQPLSGARMHLDE